MRSAAAMLAVRPGYDARSSRRARSAASAGAAPTVRGTRLGRRGRRRRWAPSTNWLALLKAAVCSATFSAASPSAVRRERALDACSTSPPRPGSWRSRPCSAACFPAEIMARGPHRRAQREPGAAGADRPASPSSARRWRRPSSRAPSARARSSAAQWASCSPRSAGRRARRPRGRPRCRRRRCRPSSSGAHPRTTRGRLRRGKADRRLRPPRADAPRRGGARRRRLRRAAAARAGPALALHRALLGLFVLRRAADAGDQRRGAGGEPTATRRRSRPGQFAAQGDEARRRPSSAVSVVGRASLLLGFRTLLACAAKPGLRVACAPRRRLQLRRRDLAPDEPRSGICGDVA